MPTTSAVGHSRAARISPRKCRWSAETNPSRTVARVSAMSPLTSFPAGGAPAPTAYNGPLAGRTAMSDVPRPQETAGPQGEGTTAAGPGAAGGGPDGTASAGARLKALRTGPAGAVPGAVWEDATA